MPWQAIPRSEWLPGQHPLLPGPLSDPIRRPIALRWSGSAGRGRVHQHSTDPPRHSRHRRQATELGLGLGTSTDSDRDDLDSPTILDPLDTDSRPNLTTCAAPNDRVSTDAHTAARPRTRYGAMALFRPLTLPGAMTHAPPLTLPRVFTCVRCRLMHPQERLLYTLRALINDRCASVGSELFLSPSGSYLVLNPCDDELTSYAFDF